MSAVLDDFMMIDPGLIAPMASNPRKDFDEREMDELVESVRIHGVIQPLIVRENVQSGLYDIVAGERRWTAAGKVDLEAVPCIVKKLSDLEVAELQLIENIDRHALSPLEESAGVSRLVELGMSQQMVCHKLSRSDDWVQLRLELPMLPEVAKDALKRGKIGLGAARRVLSLDHQEREEASQRLMELDGDLTEHMVADLIRSRYEDPKRRRSDWGKLLPMLERKFSDRATAVEDVELSHDYVKAWGAGVGHYVNVDDEVGGLSERPVESVVSWSDLVDAHGARTLLVCAGGDVSLEHVVEVVDRRVVIDAERALREQGKPHTLGPRKAKVDDEPTNQTNLTNEDDDETFEELAVRCVADAILNNPGDGVMIEILKPVLLASEIQTAADDYVTGDEG